jgi:hypothetical protein
MTEFASCNIETVDVREVWSGWAADSSAEVSAAVRFTLESPTGIGAAPEVRLSFSLADIDEQALDQIEARFLEAALAILRRIAAESPETLRDCMMRSRVSHPLV